MTDNGYIYLWRKVINSSIYTNPNVFQLAIHCILKANFKDKKVVMNGEEILVKRGSFITGLYSLKEETHLSIQTLRTSLALLERVGFISKKSTNRFSIVSVCNYNTYQNANKQTTSNQQATNKLLTTTNNDNKDNKDIYVHSPLEESFKKLWAIYPPHKRLGKKQAFNHYKASIKGGASHEDILKAIENYKTYIKDHNVAEQYIKHGSTFFNNWEDFLNYEPKQPKERCDF